MSYVIFKRKINTDKISIEFEAVTSTISDGRPLTIESESLVEAIAKAKAILTAMGATLCTKVGDPDLVLGDLPFYFVGELNQRAYDWYDTKLCLYDISQFAPIR